MDGASGLERAKKERPSLIILDLMLPEMDGIGLLTELKKSPSKVPNKNIYLLTNLAHDPILKEALNLGVSDVILKSDVNPEELINKVKEVLHTETETTNNKPVS